MFQYRADSFAPSVTAIQNHLSAVEQELEKLGRIAGRRGSAAAAEAGEQIGDAVGEALSAIVARFRDGSQAASEQAARVGRRAWRLGAGYGNDALARVGAQTNDALAKVGAQTKAQPLLTLGVALGVGLLIGAAVLGGAAATRK